MQSSLGVMRLEAHYETFQRPSSMVFHFRTPAYSPPTSQDCKALGDAYGLWENNGFGVGYALLRSNDSSFTGANVWSIDPNSKASFVDSPFQRPGEILAVISFALPTTLAPLMHWRTLLRIKRPGRTYLTGLTESVSELESDQEQVDLLYKLALESICNDLINGVLGLTGFVMVLMRYRYRSIELDPMPNFDVQDAVMSSRAMGSQRRRSRHGRG